MEYFYNGSVCFKKRTRELIRYGFRKSSECMLSDTSKV